MSKICTYCGAMNTDTATVCSRCKKALKVNISSQNSNMLNNVNGNFQFPKGQQNIGRVNHGQYQYSQKNFRPNIGNVSKQQSKSTYQSNVGQNGQHYQTPVNARIVEKKSFTIGAIVIGAAILTLAIIGLIVYKMIGAGSPKKSWLQDNMPKEVLNYTFASEKHTSNVDSIEIERRNTQDGIDDAYCVITMSDDFMKRTAYVEMVSRKYDKGEWVLESWDEYQEEEGTALEGLEEDYVYGYFDDRAGYTGLSGIKENNALDSGIISYSCNVDENYDYIETSGTIVLNGTLECIHNENCTYVPLSSANGEEIIEEVLHSYYWDLEIDTAKVKSKWKLEGAFELKDNAGTTGKYFQITTKTKGKKLNWEAKYGVYEYHWPAGHKVYDYSAQGTEKIPKYEGPASLAELKIPLMSGYYVVYTKDTVIMQNWTTAFANENILEKQ